MLVLWLWHVLLSLALADNVPGLKFGPPYLNHDHHNQNFEFGGAAVLSKSGIELTGDYAGQRGWIVSREGVLPDDFEVEIEFQLDGAARTLYGDGLAIWFLEGDEELHSGPVFGVQDKLRGTAIVIDTYRNNRPGKAFPYMVLSQNDGTRTYDIDHDGLANELAAASLRGIYNPKYPSKILVSGHKGGNIQVALNYKNDKWETFINQRFNFHGARRLAISASTGQLSARHLVTSIKATKLRPLSEYEMANQPPPVNAETKESSGWLYFLFKVAMFLIAGVGLAKLAKTWRRERLPTSYLP